MKLPGNKATALPLAALVATLALGTPQAGAQGLFDMLFGGGVRHEPQGEFPLRHQGASRTPTYPPAVVAAAA